MPSAGQAAAAGIDQLRADDERAAAAAASDQLRPHYCCAPPLNIYRMPHKFPAKLEKEKKPSFDKYNCLWKVFEAGNLFFFFQNQCKVNFALWDISKRESLPCEQS